MRLFPPAQRVLLALRSHGSFSTFLVWGHMEAGQARGWFGPPLSKAEQMGGFCLSFLFFSLLLSKDFLPDIVQGNGNLSVADNAALPTGTSSPAAEGNRA